MGSERDLLVDAFTRVRIALAHPDLSDLERSVLQLSYVHGYDDEDSRSCLVMTQREYRRTRSEALDKACVMPKLKEKETKNDDTPRSSE